MTTQETETIDWAKSAEDIKEFIGAQSEMMAQANAGKESAEWKYNSVMDFVLREGFAFEPVERPKHVGRGIVKECYKNAYVAANEHGLIYVEGYAAGIIPSQHAWCIDQNNKVIEVTWEEAGHGYFGVPFNMEYIEDTVVASGHYGVIDTHNIGWPLLVGDEGWQRRKVDG